MSHFLKFLVVFLGLLIVTSIGVIIYGITQGWHHDNDDALSSKQATTSYVTPIEPTGQPYHETYILDGAVIDDMLIDGHILTLVTERGKVVTLQRINLHNGALLGTIILK